MDENIFKLTHLISEIMSEDLSDVKKINKLALIKNVSELSNDDLLIKEVIDLKNLLNEIKDKKFTELSIVDKVDSYYLLAEFNMLNKKILLQLEKNKGLWEII